MTPSPIRGKRALVISILGAAAGLAAALWSPDGSSARQLSPVDALAQLELSADQRARIEDLRARERAWIEGLQCALAESEGKLRAAEVQRPFDAERVNDLVSTQAELIAYLRGTESRVIAEIAALLTPDQERRFSQFRTGDDDDARSAWLFALAPPSESCPAGARLAPLQPRRATLPEPHGDRENGEVPARRPGVAPQRRMLAST
jgi:Spy/CpxP family protein refolding chaperone